MEISDFFVLCDLEIWWMTLKNNRAPLLCYIKLCASFQNHGWIQTGVTVRKCSIHVKIGDFLFCVTLKFDGWSWKTIGHLYCIASSLVHHFIAISEFNLELQSGNAQFGSSKSMFFCPMCYSLLFQMYADVCGGGDWWSLLVYRTMCCNCVVCVHLSFPAMLLHLTSDAL